MSVTLSLYLGHDANMTVASGSRVLRYIEFEKIVKRRFFAFTQDARVFEDQLDTVIMPQLGVPRDAVEKLNLCWMRTDQERLLKARFPHASIDSAKTHHLTHAYSVYAFTAPRDGDVIVSFDGGGDLGDYFWVFRWENDAISAEAEFKQNLGTPYRMVGLLTDEIQSSPTCAPETNLHLAGKIMGLAPRGNRVSAFEAPLLRFYRQFQGPRGEAQVFQALQSLVQECGLKAANPGLVDGGLGSIRVERAAATDLLCTSQKIFEDEFWRRTSRYLTDARCRRILLTGGCALNVKLNTLLFERTGREVFVSPVPNDCGVSLGAAVMDAGAVRFERLQDAFIGPPATGNLQRLIHERGGRRANSNDVAERLHAGGLVGTVIGNIEAGPRALGNRSLLASPLVGGMRDRLNRIKHRESFRPVAPIVMAEFHDRFFGASPESRFMSFSPAIRPEYRDQLKEVVHFDGTCRVQTVTQVDAFLHELLGNMERMSGFPILINTSFNTKGRPIINDFEEACELLDAGQVDLLFMDGYIFERVSGAR